MSPSSRVTAMDGRPGNMLSWISEHSEGGR
jgi:hypothetical protein